MKLADELPDKAVITTHYVLSTGSAITYVSYDEDGDWQFFGNEDVEEKDARVMSVKQIIDLDPTLKDLPDMQPSQSASRMDVESKWVVEDIT